MGTEEIWKDIPGYEGIYNVSSLGEIKSFKIIKNKGYLLKKALNTAGYYVVSLSKNNKNKTFQVHQLVAMAFLGHKICGMKLVINHKNFNKLDNRVENLEIVTNRENSNKKHIKSTSQYTGVSWNNNLKKWSCYIRINTKKYHLGYFTNEIDAHNVYQNKLKELTKNEKQH